MFIIKLAKHSFFQPCQRNKPDVMSHIISSITAELLCDKA